MISPFTGGSVKLQFYWQEIKFRGATLNVQRVSYVCNESGQEFTTTEQDQMFISNMIEEWESVFVALKPPYGDIL